MLPSFPLVFVYILYFYSVHIKRPMNLVSNACAALLYTGEAEHLPQKLGAVIPELRAL